MAAGDVNFYVYVANNPLGFLDPLGLDKRPPTIEEETLGDPLLDPIDLIPTGLVTVPARVVGRVGGRVFFVLGKHAVGKMAETKVTEQMVCTTFLALSWSRALRAASRSWWGRIPLQVRSLL